MAQGPVKGAAIRLGINSGSLERDIQKLTVPRLNDGGARRHLKHLEDAGVDNVVLSLKSSSVTYHRGL